MIRIYWLLKHINFLLSSKNVEVAEYWIVNWLTKQVEVYVLSPDEASIDETKYILYNTITETNKFELQLVMFPNVTLTFDDLFDLG